MLVKVMMAQSVCSGRYLACKKLLVEWPFPPLWRTASSSAMQEQSLTSREIAVEKVAQISEVTSAAVNDVVNTVQKLEQLA